MGSYVGMPPLQISMGKLGIPQAQHPPIVLYTFTQLRFCSGGIVSQALFLVGRGRLGQSSLHQSSPATGPWRRPKGLLQLLPD